MKIISKYAVYLFVLVVTLCAVLNDGFMGTDEYWVGITRYLPAQSTAPANFLRPEDVKSPLQMVPYWVTARAAYVMGVTDPYIQYRFMLGILGLLHALIVVFALRKAWALLSENFKYPKVIAESSLSILFLVFSFCFYIPFILTRPMFETLTTPWLLLAGVFALQYSNHISKTKPNDDNRREILLPLILGVTAISIAFTLRPQVGLCALIFPWISIYRKRWRDLATTIALGGFYFILIGYLDSIFVGEFHGSLVNNIKYNFTHGHEYGSQSVITYPLLMVIFGFIPWLIYQGSPLAQKSYWKATWVIWIFIYLFIFTHSMISQKFERFLIPILPVYILVLFPIFLHLWQDRKARPWRFYSLVIFNLVLWLAATWLPPQKNIINIARYLHDHADIERVVLYRNIPDWIPEIFISRPGVVVNANSDTDPLPMCDASMALLIAEPYKGDLPIYSEWKKVASFNANPIDYLAFKLNPSKNQRRAPIDLYRCYPNGK